MVKKKGVGVGKNTFNQKIVTNPELRGKQNAKLNRYQKEDTLTRIGEWYMGGKDKGEIHKMLMANPPVKDISSTIAYNLIRAAIQRVHDIINQDAPMVVATHIEHYEHLYKYFESINHASGMNKVLKAKETLIGLWNEKREVEVVERKVLVIEKQVEYDMSRLNEQETKRMTELLNKAR